MFFYGNYFVVVAFAVAIVIYFEYVDFVVFAACAAHTLFVYCVPTVVEIVVIVVVAVVVADDVVVDMRFGHFNTVD